jgi:hypothetical protein
MEAFSSLLPLIQQISPVLSLGSTGYNLYNQYQNQQYQNNLRSFAQDPAKMNAYAAKFTQPLNAGLQTGVANEAQAYLAQRGLSESPQISEQVESQAIAPYIQQNQQQGYQDALQALGLGGGAIPPGQQQQTAQSQLAQILAGAPPPGAVNAPNPLNNTMPPQLSDLQGSPGPPIDMSSWYGNQQMPDLSAFGGG